MGENRSQSDTKSLLIRGAVVVLAALGGLLAFYAVIRFVSYLANLPSSP